MPDYIFGAACDNHDNCYEYPAKDTKKNCDDALYNQMMEICNTYEFPWYTNVQTERKECYRYAGDYHYAVKHWGDSRYDTVSGSDGEAGGGSSRDPFGPSEPSPNEQFCNAAMDEAEADCEEKNGWLADFDCFEGSQQAFHECDYDYDNPQN